MDKLDKEFSESKNIKQDNIETLKDMFPEIVTEGKIDIDVFKQLFTDEIDDRQERYSFTWNGKSKARKLAMTPSRGTLRPAPEESVNWDSSENLFIEGDNLEVLKLLQRSYHSKVKMIYIDPPYNTGKDFVYKDKFKNSINNYLKLTGQIDDSGIKISTNPEYSGRYHTDWLNMIYPRLILAREVLRDDGVIYISIDDNEVANLRKLCDEVFGEENFMCCFAWEKRYSPPPDTKGIGYVHESILMYRKTDLFERGFLPLKEEQKARYKNPDNDPRGVWKSMDYTCRYTAEERPNLYYPIENPNTGEEIFPKRTRVWAFSKDVHEKNLKENKIWWGKNGTNSVPALKNFLDDIQQGMMPMSILYYEDVGNTDEATKEFRSLIPEVKITPKPKRLIKNLALISNIENNDIVLDFFAGTCTTADAILNMNNLGDASHRFIMVQLPEPIAEKSEAYRAGYLTMADIGKERIRCAVQKLNNKQLGFKAFKLDTSNLKPWDPSFDEVQLSIENSVENIKADRSEHDVLYEILLKYGLDLSLPIEEKEIAGSKVFVAGAGALFICLAPNIDLDVVEGVTKLKDELEPELTRVVFRDSSFKNDVVKTNAVQILKQHGIEDIRSI